MPARRVFLCHSSKDKGFVERLAFDLEKVNVGVWFDKWEIRVGDSLIDKISEGIELNDYLAIIISNNSIESEWVKREVNAALMHELEEKKVVVLPILIDDCKIPVLLKEKKYGDFRKSYDEGFEEFLFSVSPENPLTIRRSKDFRTSQYLISGLSATDNNGTNTLNVAQLRKIYPYRKELQSFLGKEEKRLLFWSAVAFRTANPSKPRFMDVTTPIWGLIDGSTPEQHANWIIEGQSGVLFEYLIAHYSWAKRILGFSDKHKLYIAYKSYRELQNDLLSPLGPLSEDAMRAFLNALAEDDRQIFDDYFLPQLQKDAPIVPLLIAATARLIPPLDDEFYFKYVHGKKSFALAAVKALSEMRRTLAVDLLRKFCGNTGEKNPHDLDSTFCDLGNPEFLAQLLDWFGEEQSIEIRAKLLVPIVNVSTIDHNIIINIMNELPDSSLLPTLVRVYGRNGVDPDNRLNEWILRWSNPIDPILCEGIIFAIGKVNGIKSLQLLISLLNIDSVTVIAAVIETMAKIGRIDVYEDIKRFSEHDNILVQSAFYRALIYIRPLDWKLYIPLAKRQHPLVRICASRTFAHLATADDLLQWLDDRELDEIFKIAADEMLFAPRPFGPDWITQSHKFSPDLATLPVRLTNLDTEQVWLNQSLDLNRYLGIKLMGYTM